MDIICSSFISSAHDVMKLIFAVLYVSLNDGLYTLLQNGFLHGFFAFHYFRFLKHRHIEIVLPVSIFAFLLLSACDSAVT